MNILALNAGSSTLKYKLFRMTNETASSKALQEEILAEGMVEHSAETSIIKAAEQAVAHCKLLGIDAVAHRVVHGGDRFSEPVEITPDVLSVLRTLQELDPLHNPTEVAMIESTRRLLPGVRSAAVFDTAFHQSMPEVAYRYALPRDLSDRWKLRRYGFHGISYQYASERLSECMGANAEDARVIICHLGSGASVCAIRNGRSLDTSMGLTPLEGLVMGTRAGDIDPGLLLYLLQNKDISVAELDDILNHLSGLLGLSGRSPDVRELERAVESGDSQAELALAIFAYRVRKYIGAYATVLGGIDAIVFTGGIGEHSASMRLRICNGLEFLGVNINESRNQTQAIREPLLISAEGRSIQIWVIPADEERQAARVVQRLLSKD
jgi:acetate kinase